MSGGLPFFTSQNRRSNWSFKWNSCDLLLPCTLLHFWIHYGTKGLLEDFIIIALVLHWGHSCTVAAIVPVAGFGVMQRENRINHLTFVDHG